jgi:hypothetical protein
MDKEPIEYCFASDEVGTIQIPGRHFPTRFAATQLLVVHSPDGRILATNSSPNSWDQWMLPFISITGLLEGSDDSVAKSVKRIESVGSSTSTSNQDALEAKISSLGLVACSSPTSIGNSHYVVKYSPRTDAWTLYKFTYNKIDVTNDSLLSIDESSVWLRRIDLDSTELHGRVSSNVFEAFLRLSAQ